MPHMESDCNPMSHLTPHMESACNPMSHLMPKARGWVKALRSTWEHCYRHTLRGTSTLEGGLADTSRLMAVNQQLTASLKTMEGKAAGADSEYWR